MSLLPTICSANTFFIIGDKIQLECKDVQEVIKTKNGFVNITLTPSGKEKINQFTSKNITQSIGLIVKDKVVFFEMRILKPVIQDEKTTLNIASKYGESLDQFVQEFEHCTDNL
ncbi:hypothetical protein JXM83_07530 [Candidatus Woesearchaeota archaeon]|nr:hypothetical protein [Candidatus Woesearchaeota archaeon]